MRVELLYAEDDPASMPTRQNLVEVLTEDAFETPIQMVSVASAAFPGILVYLILWLLMPLGDD